MEKPKASEESEESPVRQFLKMIAKVIARDIYEEQQRKKSNDETLP